jgi:hypothetical protein
MFGAWGEGKFKGTLSDDEWLKNAKAVMHDDMEFDFSGVNHPMFKVWGGPGNLVAIKPWFAFLDDSEFPDMKPNFFPAPAGSNQVMCQMSSTWKYKGKEMKIDDIFVFGKLNSTRARR